MSVTRCASWAKATSKKYKGWTRWLWVPWTWITTIVCFVWEIAAILLTPVTFLVSLVLAVPVIGRLGREIWSLGLEVFWRVVGLPEAVLELFGLRLQKKLRMCVVILSDKNGQPGTTKATLDPAIASAKDIFETEAKVSLQVTGIHTISKPAPKANLELDCGVESLGDDLGRIGSQFEFWAASSDLFGSLGRLAGYGAPLVVFAVKDVAGADQGCSLGPLSDYVLVEGPTGDCLAHELAHAVGLWHVSKANNLANHACGGNKLKKWQSIVVRNSRHVTYI